MSPLRQRVHNQRRRLIAASVALFIALFGGITAQLASGHDPALATKASSSADTTKATRQTQSDQTSSMTPVTTSQS
jgi:hypothetical protein